MDDEGSASARRAGPEAKGSLIQRKAGATGGHSRRWRLRIGEETFCEIFLLGRTLVKTPAKLARQIEGQQCTELELRH
jgi:hypothetical protein